MTIYHTNQQTANTLSRDIEEAFSTFPNNRNPNKYVIEDLPLKESPSDIEKRILEIKPSQFE